MKKKLKAMSKKQLALEYGITTYVLRQWLASIENEAGPTIHLRILSTKVLRILFRVYGEPEGYDPIEN